MAEITKDVSDNFAVFEDAMRSFQKGGEAGKSNAGWARDEIPPVSGPEDFDLPPVDADLNEPPPADAPTDNDMPWWRNPADIPPRQPLFGMHYVRRTIGATIGAGGRAKTTLSHCEGVSMAIGRNLMTDEPLAGGPLRVWCINGEEDQDELDRRVAGTCQHYGITEADLGGRLFVKSVRDQPMRIATLVRNVPTLNQAVIDRLTGFIVRNRIDVFMIDPFISFHSLAENDNGHMDLIIKEGLGAIANRTNCAGEIFQHPGKPKPGQAETTVEDARGASAIIWAVRNARVLNFMTPDEAAKLGIIETERRLHIRIANGKANMGPLGTAIWMKLVIENLSNGDQIACATSWSPKNPFEGVSTRDATLAQQLAQSGTYRTNVQSSDWFGFALAKNLKINVQYGADNDPADIARIKTIIKTWMKNNVLAVEEGTDEYRKKREFIIPGTAIMNAAKPQPNDDDLAF
jgi:hypothetical protein